jgi:3-isopropylmalate/(R)-2-methylmalate dehydratase large subunit
MAAPLTLFEKIWNRHLIRANADGEQLLYVDRLLIHEGPFYAFDALKREGRGVRKPNQTFAFPDHYVPTTGRERGVEGITDP